MRVLRLCWLGVRSEEYDATLRLFRDVMGLRTEFEHATTSEFSLPSGDRVQVFGRGHAYYDFFTRHATGPVALFEVDDVRSAREELASAGVEVIGEPDHDADWEWVHFRAPDGNLYELASRRNDSA